jgi:hypothetical protein
VVVVAHTLQMPQQEDQEGVRQGALEAVLVQEVLVTLHLFRQVKAMLVGQTQWAQAVLLIVVAVAVVAQAQ